MGVRECELIFDGVSSMDIGVTVEGYPNAVLAERDFEMESIPGRNGDLVYDYGTYKNYEQTYTIHWRYVQSDSRIAAWLNKSGYKRLEDSFHPEHFRIACFTGASDVDNRMQVLKRTEATFNCKPQWFRKDGEVKMSIKSGQVLLNTGFEALPLIEIIGSGECAVNIGGNIVTISDIPSGGIVLDCDLKDAYSPDKLTNLNRLVKLSNEKFPTLVNGKNQISWTGDIESLKIVPRWWDLL